MKEIVPQDATKRIKHIQFGVLSPQETVGLSEVEVSAKDMYHIGPNGERAPIDYGVLDRRLGISDKRSICATCGLRMADCVGHYGYIRLVLPIFHVGFLKHIIAILQCTCKVSLFSRNDAFADSLSRTVLVFSWMSLQNESISGLLGDPI